MLMRVETYEKVNHTPVYIYTWREIFYSDIVNSSHQRTSDNYHHYHQRYRLEWLSWDMCQGMKQTIPNKTAWNNTWSYMS